MENTVNNTAMIKEIPTISKSVFTTDVNNGLTYPQLANKYSLPVSNIKNITKQLGLQKQVKRNLTPKFILAD